MSDQNIPPAQLVSMLYEHMESPDAFGKAVAEDPEHSIKSSRLTASFAQEMIRLIMANVRADALQRGEDVDAAIKETSRTINEAISEAKRRKGRYW